MNANEFDLDFDFEKEYGFDPPQDEPTPPAQTPVEDDLDLKAILESGFGEEFGSEYGGDFDYGPDDFPVEEEPPMDAPQNTDPAAEEYTLPEEPEREERSAPRQRRERPAQAERTEPREPEIPASQMPDAPRRKKPLSPMRRFKNEMLPKLIAGLAAVLCLIFVIGAVSRAVKNPAGSKDPSEPSTMSAEAQQKQQADRLLEEAALLAAGYDYDAAIAKLESFTGDKTKFTEIETRLSEYKQTKSTLIEHNDPASVTNLIFNPLIADPQRAFTNKELGGKYNMNFVTTGEFRKILDQLYANGYVLVEMSDIISETPSGDTVSYGAKTLRLPDGKKPVMITEMLVNYFNYMIDSDKDGKADKDGAGFASRLVVHNNEVKAEFVSSAGETLVGDYDLVPILEAFIEEHPDFSYRGARATLAVTGFEGIFGYRINEETKEKVSQEYYDEQVAGAKEVVAALRNAGYEIACNTYEQKRYGTMPASDIQADIAKWQQQIEPVTGQLKTLVYVRGSDSDISSTGDYSGSKYNVLVDAGFHYFICADSGKTKVTSDYVRIVGKMVTGQYMYHTPTNYAGLFDAKAILDSLRGDVPQK